MTTPAASTVSAGDAEVVCHNDLAPNNTVYSGAGLGDGGSGLRPVAFIDWDLAAPGRRIQTAAAAGDPAMVRLRDDGAVREVRAAFGWVAENRAELEGS
jgi:Ser/Thr protein kinase RdoA (MazF antagonist)